MIAKVECALVAGSVGSAKTLPINSTETYFTTSSYLSRLEAKKVAIDVSSLPLRLRVGSTDLNTLQHILYFENSNDGILLLVSCIYI